MRALFVPPFPVPWVTDGLHANRVFTVFLIMYRVRGALLIGIFFTSILSWPRPTSVTYFPHTPAGDAAFAFFKRIVAFHPITKVANVLEVLGTFFSSFLLCSDNTDVSALWIV